MIWTRSFWTAAAERAAKSFAGVLLAFLPAAGTGAVPALNWGDMLVLGGYAALGSVLFSVVSSGVGGIGPSLANEVISPPAVDPDDAGHADMVTVLIAASSAIVVVAVYVLIFR